MKNRKIIFYNKMSPPIFFFLGAIYSLIGTMLFEAKLLILYYIALPMTILSLYIIFLILTREMVGGEQK